MGRLRQKKKKRDSEISFPNFLKEENRIVFMAEAICAADIGMERFTAGRSRENVCKRFDLTNLQLNLQSVM